MRGGVRLRINTLAANLKLILISPQIQATIGGQLALVDPYTAGRIGIRKPKG